MEITALNNNSVKTAVKLQQRKYRDSENKFLLEGFKVIQEAYFDGIEIEKVFVKREKAAEYNFIKDKIILTNEAVLKKISTTDTAPDAVGVAVQKHFSLKNIKTARKVILLENIKDMGNLGTILRTAAGFGVDAVVLFGECADIYNPKCVRSSAGCLWKLPFVKLKDFNELEKFFSGFRRVATLPRSKNSLKYFNVTFPILVMFGSEAEGLSRELIDFATDNVKIEMSDNVESLNLSVSCAVVMYKFFIV